VNGSAGRIWTVTIVAYCLLGPAWPVAAGEGPASSAGDFNGAVAPLLVRSCLGCHNGSEAGGGLDLTRRETLLKGGDGGPAVVPGAADESYLLDRVAAGEMPPPGKAAPLTPEHVAALTAWVRSGAPWPNGRVLSPFEFTTERRAGLDWWSLKPPMRPHVPLTRLAAGAPAGPAAWMRTPIDAFIAQKLEANGLSPAPEAERATLLRRAKFDLLGLPPTPEEIDRFVADLAPNAYERLIDGLLASPHYGERWGRHWLDVVRFGESDGYETNKPRPNAWPYRDWVIAAFNDDLPYPRFVLEQLAGDQVGADVATGFLVGGAHDVVGNQTLEGQLQQRTDDLNDMLAATSTAFLGLTAQCARCHDHKFDPITQRDYYALQAVFAGVTHGERDLKRPADDERLRGEPETRRQLATVDRELSAFEPLAQTTPPFESAGRRPPVHHLGNIDRFRPTPARFVRFTALATNDSEPCLDELEVYTAGPSPRNVGLAAAGAKATASSVFANGAVAIHQLAHVHDGLYGNSHSWISAEAGTGWVQLELPALVEIERVAWARDREGAFSDRLPVRYKVEVAVEPNQWRLVAGGDDRRPYALGAPREADVPTETLPADDAKHLAALVARRQELLSRLPAAALQKVYAGAFGQAGPTHRLHRGDPMQPREAVVPGAITALGRPLELSADAPESQRRLALARWIGDEANPLAARVMVNRLWQYHFGQGLLATPSNFGFQGGLPTHPELLDWLASEFVARGWSVKAMHRLIMHSAVYRQAGRFDVSAAAVDAGDRLLWRYPPRRLEAELIRDAILAVSGRLDRTPGGPGYDPFEPNTNYVHVYTPKTVFGPAEWRRMVYQQQARMQPDSTFGAFDCPDASQAMPKRNISTTALQALNLLNSPFVARQAEFFAERLVSEAGTDSAAQIRRAFRLAFGREPEADELAAAGALIARHGPAAFCRAVFNANEFLYVD